MQQVPNEVLERILRYASNQKADARCVKLVSRRWNALSAKVVQHRKFSVVDTIHYLSPHGLDIDDSYDLEQLINHLGLRTNQWCIAGGFCAYLDGRTTKYNDIDVFFAVYSQHQRAAFMRMKRSYNTYIYEDQNILASWNETLRTNTNMYDWVTLNITILDYTDRPQGPYLDFVADVLNYFDQNICRVAFDHHTDKFVTVDGPCSYRFPDRSWDRWKERRSKYQSRTTQKWDEYQF